MRNRFDADMERLHTMMMEMGALCESGIASAIKALLEKDDDNARRAIDLEEEVNAREREIEQLCYSLLLRQQPVAGDLRKVSAALKMITDMERISDQAADIAEIALMGNLSLGEDYNSIKEMSIACIGMVTNCIDAYVHQDTLLARRVIEDDDVVDRFFDEIKQRLTREIVLKPELAESHVDILMVAKYLERIADHAENIAGWVIFIETGRRGEEEPGS